jgi:two-component system sensor histidine kinase DesK
MTRAFWTPQHPRRVLVVATVAVASISPVFTSFGTPGLPGRGPLVPAVLGVALAALQLRHSLAAARGQRPRGGLWTLLAMAALVYAPMPWFAYNWFSTQALLTASALMVLRGRRLAIAAATAPTLGTVLFFPVVYASHLAPATWTATGTIFEMGWFGLGISMQAAVVYGVARMVRAADELQAAHTELAELAIAQERLRVSRDLHDLIGQSLSAVSLRGDLALRLLQNDPAAAEVEIANVTATARSALHDVLTVTRDGTSIDLRTEAAGAETLLAAAGIDARVELDSAGLPAPARAVFAWALREGITNVLRHSDATSCSITGTRSAGSVRLEIINDGVRSASGPGNGLTGLTERARAFSGVVTAGPAPDGRFRLLVELPAEAS